MSWSLAPGTVAAKGAVFELGVLSIDGLESAALPPCNLLVMLAAKLTKI
jgi:hypothetical protein